MCFFHGFPHESVPGTRPTFSGCRDQVRLPAHNRPSGLNVGQRRPAGSELAERLGEALQRNTHAHRALLQHIERHARRLSGIEAGQELLGQWIAEDAAVRETNLERPGSGLASVDLNLHACAQNGPERRGDLDRGGKGLAVLRLDPVQPSDMDDQDLLAVLGLADLAHRTLIRRLGGADDAASSSNNG